METARAQCTTLSVSRTRSNNYTISIERCGSMRFAGSTLVATFLVATGAIDHVTATLKPKP
jgi:hypothetical protein